MAGFEVITYGRFWVIAKVSAGATTLRFGRGVAFLAVGMWFPCAG